MEQMTTGGPVGLNLVDFDRLAVWMSRHGLGGGPPENIQWIGGGTQNIIVRFDRGGRSYVLRRPPSQSLSDASKVMLREARILRALAGSAVPHPPLIIECADRDVLGESFYLMEPVNGFNATDGLPANYRTAAAQRQMAFSVVEALGELGKLDYLECGLADFGKLDNYLERQTGRWRSQLEGYARFPFWTGPEGLGCVADVAAWLDDNLPTSFIPGIVHGDFHLSNIMLRPDRVGVTAIVDWELATIGDPLLDLGWLIATWPGPTGEDTGSSIAVPNAFALPTPDELIASYAAASDRDLENLGWMIVLACYKLSIIQEGSHARACAEERTGSPARRDHDWAVAMMERALNFIDRQHEIRAASVSQTFRKTKRQG